MATTARKIDVRPQRADSVWPTPEQLRLLRAALWTGDEARRAWEEWKARAEVGALDISSWNLLPLVWHNLSNAGHRDALLDECHGFYRFHSARNLVRLRQARAVIAELQAQGADIVVLKGVALLAGYYRNAGLRPMADVDLLMSWPQAQQAAAHLMAKGWRPQVDYLTWDQIEPRLQCSFGWRRGREEIDLHWHVLHRAPAERVTREFMQRARPVEVEGWPVRSLAPEDLLLHVCSHGVQYSTLAPLRWLADVAWILRVDGARFDWERVWEMARMTGSTLPLAEGLAYAAAELRIPVPEEILARFRAYRPSWWERMDYRRTTSADQGGRWLRAWHLARVLRETGGRGPWLQRWRRMARYLCIRWESPSLAAAGGLMVKKVLSGHRGTWATDHGKERAL